MIAAICEVSSGGWRLAPVAGERIDRTRLSLRRFSTTDLLDYTSRDISAWLALLWRVHDRVALRLDGLFSHLRLGDAASTHD